MNRRGFFGAITGLLACLWGTDKAKAAVREPKADPQPIPPPLAQPTLLSRKIEEVLHFESRDLTVTDLWVGTAGAAPETLVKGRPVGHRTNCIADAGSPHAPFESVYRYKV